MAKPTCSVPECVMLSRAVGLCDTHYKRFRKYGTATPVFEVVCGRCGDRFRTSMQRRRYCDGCKDGRRAEDMPPNRRMRCAGCNRWIYKTSTSAPEGKAKCKDCRGSRSKHGTATCYRGGCRCDDCREAMSEYMRAYARRVKDKHGVGPASVYRRKFKERHGYWPQARYGYDIPHRVRRAVYERDGWVCQICGGLISRDYDPYDRLAPSLDHIVPQSSVLLPDHSEANLRMVHTVCNTIRGNGVFSDDEVRVRSARFVS